MSPLVYDPRTFFPDESVHDGNTTASYPVPFAGYTGHPLTSVGKLPGYSAVKFFMKALTDSVRLK